MFPEHSNDMDPALWPVPSPQNTYFNVPTFAMDEAHHFCPSKNSIMRSFDIIDSLKESITSPILLGDGDSISQIDLVRVLRVLALPVILAIFYFVFRRGGSSSNSKSPTAESSHVKDDQSFVKESFDVEKCEQELTTV